MCGEACLSKNDCNYWVYSPYKVQSKESACTVRCLYPWILFGIIPLVLPLRVCFTLILGAVLNGRCNDLLPYRIEYGRVPKIFKIQTFIQNFELLDFTRREGQRGGENNLSLKSNGVKAT